MTLMGDLTANEWKGAKSRGSWVSEPEAAALYALATTCPAHVVEIGCYQGGTSWLLANACDRLTMIDPCTHSRTSRELVRKNLEGMWHKTTWLRTIDHKMYPMWEGTVSMLFLDHDHGLQSTIDSLLGWRPHMAPGAPVCVHDYGPKKKRRQTAEKVEAAVKASGIEVCEVVDTLAICRWRD